MIYYTLYLMHQSFHFHAWDIFVDIETDLAEEVFPFVT